MEDNKVCKECGNDQFVSNRLVYQQVVYSGNGDLIETGQIVPHGSRTQMYTCSNCFAVYPSLWQLVSEKTFHDKIAVQEKA